MTLRSTEVDSRRHLQQARSSLVVFSPLRLGKRLYSIRPCVESLRTPLSHESNGIFRQHVPYFCLRNLFVPANNRILQVSISHDRLISAWVPWLRIYKTKSVFRPPLNFFYSFSQPMTVRFHDRISQATQILVTDRPTKLQAPSWCRANEGNTDGIQ